MSTSWNDDYPFALKIRPLPNTFNIFEWHLFNLHMKLAGFYPLIDLLRALTNRFWGNARSTTENLEPRGP